MLSSNSRFKKAISLLIQLTTCLLILMSLPFAGKAQEMIVSPPIELMEEWKPLHEANGVKFLAKVVKCGDREMMYLHIQNLTPTAKEVTLGFQTGTIRQSVSNFRIQPLQELHINCEGGGGIPPLILESTHLVRIDTIIKSL